MQVTVLKALVCSWPWVMEIFRLSQLLCYLSWMNGVEEQLWLREGWHCECRKCETFTNPVADQLSTLVRNGVTHKLRSLSLWATFCFQLQWYKSIDFPSIPTPVLFQCSQQPSWGNTREEKEVNRKNCTLQFYYTCFQPFGLVEDVLSGHQELWGHSEPLAALLQAHQCWHENPSQACMCMLLNMQ